MKRRQLIQSAGLTVAGLSAVPVVGASEDADPRPEPYEGTSPNENVPMTATGAIGMWGENGEIPAGDWILHDNGWKTFPSKDAAKEFANSTVQTYIVDGEEFILDSFDDWDYKSGRNGLMFEYITPPKPKGTTYEVRWEVKSEIQKYEWLEDLFPVSNQVIIIDRN